MLKYLVKKELKEVNQYIDKRIKLGLPYKELERVRVELVAILDNK